MVAPGDDADKRKQEGLLGRFKSAAVAMMRTKSPSQASQPPPPPPMKPLEPTKPEDFETNEEVEPVLFGVSLEDAHDHHPERFDAQGVPLFMVTCLDWIKEKHADCEGLFRINGSSSTIKGLIQMVEQNSLELPEQLDPHAVTGLIKQYLRDLPEPLLGSQMYEAWAELCQLHDAAQKAALSAYLLAQLPHPHPAVFAFLQDRLQDLAEHAEQTKMDALNLATCIGPNLLRPPTENEMNVISVTSTAAQVCLHLLQTTNQEPLVAPIKAIARATFDYEPVNADELSLLEGQLVFIQDDGEEWWTGFTVLDQGESKRFPNNYVSLLGQEEDSMRQSASEEVSVAARIALLDEDIKALRLQLGEEREQRQKLEALIPALTETQQQLLNLLQFGNLSAHPLPFPNPIAATMPNTENSQSGNEASSERSD